MHRNLFAPATLPYTWISVDSRTLRERVWAMLDARSQSREDIGPGDGVLRMIVCMLINFASGDPKTPSLLDELWTLRNIRARALDWATGSHHPDHVKLPTDLDELICHPEFLRAHGVPSALRIYQNGTIDVECANFDEEFGENATLMVLDQLDIGGNEDTRPLRRSWENAQSAGEPDLIAALPTFGPRIGVPSMFAGTVLTGDMVFNLELLTLFEFESMPAFGQFLFSMIEAPLAGPVLLIGGLLSTMLRYLPTHQS